jgi:hypothetical protein
MNNLLLFYLDNLWDKYKYILIGIACAGIILIGLFFLARKKCKEVI